MIARKLKAWRRQNGIKQIALAEMLGVSQTAVSFWENGRDKPAPAVMARIKDLMAGSIRNEVMLEKAFTQRQPGLMAVFDFDGTRLLAPSKGFRALWPQVAELEGQFMADHLVDEARTLIFDDDLSYAIASGSLGMVGGVSMRQTDLAFDPVVQHRWHICFRRYGHMTLMSMSYEPCDGDEQAGITDIIHLDDLK